MTVKIKQEATLHGSSNHERRYLEYNIKLKTSMFITPRTQYPNFSLGIVSLQKRPLQKIIQQNKNP